ncbi:hypothetical protein B0H10DRAFT_1970390 [Mycena sp. CBHHK59/15]|nr:hypothetical protein B0H10DRAFT_1970390 [Mycena sp. CBHHK59/15]
MNVHEGSFFHIFTYIPLGDIVYSYHTHVIKNHDTAPMISYCPTRSGVGSASIVIQPSEGCYSTINDKGQILHILLVPPIQVKQISRPLYDWPYVTQFEQTVYYLQDGDILCTAYLAGQSMRRKRSIYEYELREVLSNKLIVWSSYLVSPSTWVDTKTLHSNVMVRSRFEKVPKSKREAPARPITANRITKARACKCNRHRKMFSLAYRSQARSIDRLTATSLGHHSEQSQRGIDKSDAP